MLKTDQNEPNDRVRFQQVLALLASNGHGRNIALGPLIMEKFADWQRRWLEEIAEALVAPRDDVARTLNQMVANGSYKSKSETRVRGRSKSRNIGSSPKPRR